MDERLAAEPWERSPTEVRILPCAPDFVSMNRFWIALAAYAGIAITAWFTLDDVRVRVITVVVLAAFAVRTVTTHAREKLDSQQ